MHGFYKGFTVVMEEEMCFIWDIQGSCCNLPVPWAKPTVTLPVPLLLDVARRKELMGFSSPTCRGMDADMVYTHYSSSWYKSQCDITDNFNLLGWIAHFRLTSNSCFDGLCYNRHFVTTVQILAVLFGFWLKNCSLDVFIERKQFFDCEE